MKTLEAVIEEMRTIKSPDFRRQLDWANDIERVVNEEDFTKGRYWSRKIKRGLAEVNRLENEVADWQAWGIFVRNDIQELEEENLRLRKQIYGE